MSDQIPPPPPSIPSAPELGDFYPAPSQFLYVDPGHVQGEPWIEAQVAVTLVDAMIAGTVPGYSPGN